MSTGEEAYLALVIAAFLSYFAVLAYGIAVASTRPNERAAPDYRIEKTGGSAATHAH